MSDRDAFRDAQQERRNHGLKARHETREARAQTVIGEMEQQLYVQAERGFVRVVIADEEGTSFAAMRLAPEAAERAIRILTQALVIAREIGSRDPA